MTFSIKKSMAGVVASCINDALQRSGADEVMDIRVWMQKWPSVECGFGETLSSEPKECIAPTVVVKIHKKLRYVYHNGIFAYIITNAVSMQYYNAMNSRRLPGACDKAEISMLNAT